MLLGTPFLFIPFVFIFSHYDEDRFSRAHKVRRVTAATAGPINTHDGLLFPTDVLKLSNGDYPQRFVSGNLNDECVMRDGQLGICRTFETCASNLFFGHHSTQNLVMCEMHQFICCPAIPSYTPQYPPKLKVKYPKDPPKPTPSLPKKKIDLSLASVSKPGTMGWPKKDQIGQVDYKGTQVTELIPKPILTPIEISPNVNQIEKEPIKETIEDDDFSFRNSDPQKICGLYKGNERKDEELWPWIVSIGVRSGGDDGSIHWLCVGTLITPKYIVSTARCLEKSPNVVAFGKILLGRTRGNFATEPILEQVIKSANNKQNGTGYQNIGLVRIHPVNVTRKILPACIPFLGGVLDIIAFANFKNISTVGYQTRRDDGQITFEIEEEKILKNSQCNRVFGKMIKKKKPFVNFPLGASHTNMCGMSKRNSALCQIEGAPLVYFDPASESLVLIGVSSGSEKCLKTRRLSIFTRLNSFSSWIRENVGSLPSPVTCYF